MKKHAIVRTASPLLIAPLVLTIMVSCATWSKAAQTPPASRDEARSGATTNGRDEYHVQTPVEGVRDVPGKVSSIGPAPGAALTRDAW